MTNTMTKEAKVRIGFDVNLGEAKKGFQDSAKAAELLEKAIDKAGQKQKALREEFGTNRMQAVAGALGAVSKAASGMSDEVAKALSGFAVVSNIIDMFNSLNGSITNSVKSLREMKAVEATMSSLQGIQYAGRAAGGSVASVAGGTLHSVVGAAAGGAVVSAAGQFATSSATAQVKSAIEKATEKLGDKASSRADGLFDSIIDSIISKKKTGSAMVPSAGKVGGVAGWNDEVYDATWRFNTPRLIGRDQSMGEYVREAMLSHTPGVAGKSSTSFMQRAGTELFSPKHRWNAMGGGIVGGLVGAGVGFAASGGTVEGTATGGGIGSLVGSVGNIAAGGGLLKTAAAGMMASPWGIAAAGAGAVGLSILSAFTGDKSKLGKIADKVFDGIGEFFVGIFSDAKEKEEKAQKKLAAKQAEIDRRESVDAVLVPIRRAREEAFEGIRAEQSSLRVHQGLVGNGQVGAGLDAAIEYSGQNLSEANSRLMQASAARLRGGALGEGVDKDRLRKNEASAMTDFQLQIAAQKQLTDARAAGQLATIDPQIADARSISANANANLNKMLSQQQKVARGELTQLESGVTKAAINDAYEKAEASTKRLIELEKQRGDIKRSVLEVQKQEFAVYREQAKSQEQAARQALDEKEGTIASAKLEFGTMGEIERGNVLALAKKLKEGGVESLSENERDYAISKPSIFGGVVRPQLMALSDKVGFSDLQSLTGLNTNKETDALKQAQAFKVDIERNITNVLQANEAKLADELAGKVSPLVKSLTMIVEKKFDEMTLQMERQIEAAIHKNKIGG